MTPLRFPAPQTFQCPQQLHDFMTQFYASFQAAQTTAMTSPADSLASSTQSLTLPAMNQQSWIPQAPVAYRPTGISPLPVLDPILDWNVTPPRLLPDPLNIPFPPHPGPVYNTFHVLMDSFTSPTPDPSVVLHHTNFNNMAITQETCKGVRYLYTESAIAPFNIMRVCDQEQLNQLQEAINLHPKAKLRTAMSRLPLCKPLFPGLKAFDDHCDNLTDGRSRECSAPVKIAARRSAILQAEGFLETLADFLTPEALNLWIYQDPIFRNDKHQPFLAELVHTFGYYRPFFPIYAKDPYEEIFALAETMTLILSTYTEVFTSSVQPSLLCLITLAHYAKAYHTKTGRNPALPAWTILYNRTVAHLMTKYEVLREARWQFPIIP